MGNGFNLCHLPEGGGGSSFRMWALPGKSKSKRASGCYSMPLLLLCLLYPAWVTPLGIQHVVAPVAAQVEDRVEERHLTL